MMHRGTDHALQNRLQAARRRNEAARLRGKWTRALSDACGIDLAEDVFLCVAETQRLRTQFFAKLRECPAEVRRINWPDTALREATRFLAGLSFQSARSAQAVLFSSVDGILGAVIVPPGSVIDNAPAVWGVVSQDLALTLMDLSAGFCLEFNYYDIEGRYVPAGVYELAFWGMA